MFDRGLHGIKAPRRGCRPSTGAQVAGGPAQARAENRETRTAAAIYPVAFVTVANRSGIASTAIRMPIDSTDPDASSGVNPRQLPLAPDGSRSMILGAQNAVGDKLFGARSPQCDTSP
jgi:hypothetical protein